MAVISEGFGYWLSGLIDGEGSFGIVAQKKNGKVYHQPRFTIGLRDDDGAVIEHIRRMLNIGAMTHRERANKGSNPQTELHVASYADGIALIAVLDRFPLQTKKAKAYQIWKQAILGRMQTPPVNQAVLADLQKAIHFANSYNSPALHPSSYPPLQIKRGD